MARQRCDLTAKDLMRRVYKMVMDILSNIIIIWGGPRNKAQRGSSIVWGPNLTLANTKWARPPAQAGYSPGERHLLLLYQLWADKSRQTWMYATCLSLWQPSKWCEQLPRPELTSHPRLQLFEDGDKSQTAPAMRQGRHDWTTLRKL